MIPHSHDSKLNLTKSVPSFQLLLTSITTFSHLPQHPPCPHRDKPRLLASFSSHTIPQIHHSISCRHIKTHHPSLLPRTLYRKRLFGFPAMTVALTISLQAGTLLRHALHNFLYTSLLKSRSPYKWPPFDSLLSIVVLSLALPIDTFLHLLLSTFCLSSLTFRVRSREDFQCTSPTPLPLCLYLCESTLSFTHLFSNICLSSSAYRNRLTRDRHSIPPSPLPSNCYCCKQGFLYTLLFSSQHTRFPHTSLLLDRGRSLHSPLTTAVLPLSLKTRTILHLFILNTFFCEAQQTVVAL